MGGQNFNVGDAAAQHRCLCRVFAIHMHRLHVRASADKLVLVLAVTVEQHGHRHANGLLVEINWTVPFGKGPVGVSYRGPDALSPAGTAFLKALRHTAKAMRES